MNLSNKQTIHNCADFPNIIAQQNIFGGVHPGGYDPQIRTQRILLYNAPTPKFHHHMFTRSEVIMWTNTHTQTNRRPTVCYYDRQRPRPHYCLSSLLIEREGKADTIASWEKTERIYWWDSYSWSFMNIQQVHHFITARRYASAVLAVIVCLSVCLSVRLSVTSQSCT